jgi:NSS family neurotransmitter:Na+ symporter
VVRSLFLPGALDGLDALFRPHWEALLHPGVWIAAYGQIFFSLSVAFGIMLTYASYLKKKTDLTGSGLVVGFANSGFEILCGIGVFSALGFMAQAQGVAVDEVVADGVGLAFIAFPTIISEAPAGALIGVLFFGSLVLAGFTSLISIVEVVIAAFQDKFGLSRLPATLGVCIPIAVVSTVLFSTTMGLPLLDVMDKWANEYGIVAAALVSSLIVAFVLRGMPTLRDHLNFRGSFRIGRWWYACVAIIAPLVLGVSLVGGTLDLITSDTTYSEYPGWFNFVFGWMMAIGLVVIAIALSLVPWPASSNLHKADSDGDPIAPEVVSGQGLVSRPEATTPHELRSAGR